VAVSWLRVKRKKREQLVVMIPWLTLIDYITDYSRNVQLALQYI
jgi:hypothetical protein